MIEEMYRDEFAEESDPLLASSGTRQSVADSAEEWHQTLIKLTFFSHPHFLMLMELWFLDLEMEKKIFNFLKFSPAMWYPKHGWKSF